ncbi:hypothetical protein [Eudoraea chungangensis]|uniref:hypothetical protein n=1 Tax=Eudoraea chungangensis TaxID=1481905 RepID=UPI0023EA9021|nr:hypothetical protein [Eudoraea chungangensis]
MLLIGLGSCKKNQTPPGFNPGTENPIALHHYRLGWMQIMDYGEWTKAENSFRTATKADPNFALGNCLVGRISTNMAERKRLLEKITAQEKNATKDQRLLIEIYKSSIIRMNNREMGIQIPDTLKAVRYLLAENNSKKFVQKYPEEDYVKAEYIEILHSKYGPETALDSLEFLTNSLQKVLPFYLGYAATLHAEIGNYGEASLLLQVLKNRQNDTLRPNYYLSKGQVYKEFDSIALAKKYIKKAIALDTNHLIAKRLLNSFH